jgi:phosphoglycolate phosphatase
MNSAQKFVLFDFDGVIADSLTLAYDVARIVHPEANLTPEAYVALFEGNVYESIKNAQWGTSREKEYFAEFAPRAEKEVGLIQDITNAVSKLHEGYTLIIVSSTISDSIQAFLSRYNLARYFTEVMGSDVHKSKVEKMRMIFEKYETVPDRCVFVTDTLGDIREAKEHEMGAIAVGWGWHERATLERGIPFRIVETPRELPDAVDDYFARDSV